MTTPIWYDLRNAVYAKDFSKARTLLHENPHLIDLRNGIGETVLHFLAVENDIEGIAWLHKQGFGINEKNEFGTPIIFEVAGLEYKELFQWFVSEGADLEITDSDNHKILEYLEEYDNQSMIDFLKNMKI